VVHRDVKPGNIVVVDGRARLIDFGTAMSAGRRSSAGTPTFSSANACLGGPACFRDDVESLCYSIFALVGNTNTSRWFELPMEDLDDDIAQLIWQHAEIDVWEHEI
jgi:serine/threonine protein kinase